MSAAYLRHWLSALAGWNRPISSSPNRQFGASNARNSPDLIATILL
jgi:hypothetical protein